MSGKSYNSVRSRIDTDLMFDTMIREINKIEDNGIIAIDGTIAEKNGKSIEAARYIYDHSIGKTVWGIQFATAVFSGRCRIYPVSAIVYERKEKIDDKKRKKGEKSKGIQIKDRYPEICNVEMHILRPSLFSSHRGYMVLHKGPRLISERKTFSVGIPEQGKQEG